MAKRNKAEIEALKMLKERVNLEGARIAFSEEQVGSIIESKGYHRDHTPEIREATRLYRETWILPIIDALIEGDTARLKDLL